VFRAHHETLDTNVAVKVLRLTDVADREVRQRALHAEAKILARISHPNVIRVLDFENDAEYPYLVLEYIDGFVLSDLLQQCGRLVPERALAIITQTAQALAAAYQVGVVHRDVKPANILLTAEGDVKLADLGLAGVLGELQLGTTGDGQPLLWGGTLPYMPSEQFTHPSVNCRADIYALGVCFYQMLTGTLPYQANTPMELLLAHSERPIPPLAQTLPDLAPAWDKLLRRMLSQEANMRPAYAELVTELRRLATVSASKSALRQAAPKSGSQLLRWLGWERKN
jgi:serine/threonine protein kinase